MGGAGAELQALGFLLRSGLWEQCQAGLEGIRGLQGAGPVRDGGADLAAEPAGFFTGNGVEVDLMAGGVDQLGVQQIRPGDNRPALVVGDDWHRWLDPLAGVDLSGRHHRGEDIGVVVVGVVGVGVGVVGGLDHRGLAVDQGDRPPLDGRHLAPDGVVVPHHPGSVSGLECTETDAGAEVVAQLAVDDRGVRALQPEHEVDLRGTGQTSQVGEPVQNRRLGGHALGLGLGVPLAHGGQEGRHLVDDQHNRVQILGADQSITDEVVTLPHGLVGEVDQPHLRVYLLGQELDVAPVLVAHELDLFAVHQPDPPAGLRELLDHAVLTDGLTPTGAADNQQVRVFLGPPG